MISTTSKIQNQELADYLFTLLRCSSQEGIPDIYTQKAQSFGHMFDEKFAESLPKYIEGGILTVEVIDFGVYAQKTQILGSMFDEFAKSLSNCIEIGISTIEVTDSGGKGFGKVFGLKIETFCINTHHGRVAWIAYFLDTPDSACISPFSRKENPVIDWQRQ